MPNRTIEEIISDSKAASKEQINELRQSITHLEDIGLTDENTVKFIASLKEKVEELEKIGSDYNEELEETKENWNNPVLRFWQENHSTLFTVAAAGAAIAIAGTIACTLSNNCE